MSRMEIDSPSEPAGGKLSDLVIQVGSSPVVEIRRVRYRYSD